MVGVVIACALAGTLLVLVNEIGKQLPPDGRVCRAGRVLAAWLRLQLGGRRVHAPTWCTPGRVDAVCDLSADPGFDGGRAAARRSPERPAIDESRRGIRGPVEASWPDLDVPAPAPSHP